MSDWSGVACDRCGGVFERDPNRHHDDRPEALYICVRGTTTMAANMPRPVFDGACREDLQTTEAEFKDLCSACDDEIGVALADLFRPMMKREEEKDEAPSTQVLCATCTHRMGRPSGCNLGIQVTDCLRYEEGTCVPSGL